MPGETVVTGTARRARLLREVQQEFIPDCDGLSMPSAGKRAACALEPIACRIGKIDQSAATAAI
jgi:hypothetical protein